MSRKKTPFHRTLPGLVALFLVLGAACKDESPTEPSPPPSDGGTSPPPAAKAFIRAAQLTEEARTVDMVLNGTVASTSIAYPGVGRYIDVDAGEYRVQFFPAGSRQQALVETNVTLGAGQVVTVALVGPSIETATIFDPTVSASNRASVRLLNAVPDYPKELDLKILNGPFVVQNVGYPTASGYKELIPGRYDVEIRRASSTEVVTTSLDHMFSAGVGYTVFIVGTLRRDDIEVFVASDAH